MPGILEHLQEIEVFTCDDYNRIAFDKGYTIADLKGLVSDGLVHKLNDNLYCVKMAMRYLIASKLAPDSYLCYHSALEYHNMYTQVYYWIYVASNYPLKDFDLDSIHYAVVSSPFQEGVITTDKGYRVTTVERTIVDCLKDIGKAGGVEELVEAFDTLPQYKVDFELLTRFLDLYHIRSLYSRAGYFFENYRDSLNVPDKFLEYLEWNKSKSLCYMGCMSKRIYINGLGGYKSKRWDLVVPDFIHQRLTCDYAGIEEF